MIYFHKMTYLLLVTLLFCSSAQASLLEFDLFSAGDRLITRDTDTGLDWLDLTETIDFSYDEMLMELGDGGLFAGFRYATTTDIDRLQQSAELSSGLFFTITPSIYQRVADLIDMVGVTNFDSDTGYKAAYGITSDPFLPTSTIDDRIFRGFSLTAGASASQGVIPDNLSSPFIGSWLIRDTPTAVPLPSTIFLFVSGIAILLGWRSISERRERIEEILGQTRVSRYIGNKFQQMRPGDREPLNDIGKLKLSAAAFGA